MAISCIFLDRRTIALTDRQNDQPAMIRVFSLSRRETGTKLAVFEPPSLATDLLVYLRGPSDSAPYTPVSSPIPTPFYSNPKTDLVAIEFADYRLAVVILIDVEVLKQTFDYPRGTPIPYFVWNSGQNSRAFRSEGRLDSLGSSFSGGRYSTFKNILWDGSEVIISESVVTRGRAHKAGFTRPPSHPTDEENETLSVDSPLKDVFQYSQPTRQMKRKLDSPEKSTCAFIDADDERIVLVQVSGVLFSCQSFSNVWFVVIVTQAEDLWDENRDLVILTF